MTAPNRRWPRFTLRTLLILITVAACATGWLVWQWELTDMELGSGSGYIDPLEIGLLLGALTTAIAFGVWILWPKRRDDP